MKNVTSIDLDSTFAPKQQEQPQPQPQEQVSKPVVSWDEILTEWSYRLPKGYPTIVDGVFTEYEEVKILNEIMEERFGETLPLPAEVDEAVNSSELSSNPTDVKEALVCLFVDASLTDKSIIDLYRSGLDKKLDPTQREVS